MSGCYSYSSGFYKRSSSPWTSKDRLTGGTGWLSDMVRAQVALTFITLLALLGICVWSFTVQRRTHGARRLFIWFLPAIVLNIIGYLWIAIKSILTEECASVAGVYAIFDVIFSSFRSLGMIFLLAGIFNELVVRKFTNGANANDTAGQRLRSRQLMVHLGYCVLLVLLWFIALCLRLAVTVQLFEDVGSGLGQQRTAQFRLGLASSSLYLIAAVYVLVQAVMLLLRPHCKDKKTNILFLALVAIPLLVIAIWELAIDTTVYSLLDGTNIPDVNLGDLIFASFVFGIVCIIAIFVGLILVIKGAYPEDDHGESQDDSMGVPVSGPSPAPRGGEGSGHWDSQSMRDHSQDPLYNGPHSGYQV